MLRLPRRTLFALEAVVDIAYNARPDPVQAKEITRRQGIPPRYLEQVMQQLVRAGILKGVRGPRGGYTLARERRRISVGEVIRAIEGFDDQENGDAQEPGSPIGIKVVRPLLDDLRAELEKRLDQTTLEDLCSTAQLSEVPLVTPARADFTI
jgi:Rrf2 family iron-sulfur cluster assembly transcriptional regulator